MSGVPGTTQGFEDDAMGHAVKENPAKKLRVLILDFTDLGGDVGRKGVDAKVDGFQRRFCVEVSH